MASGSRETSSRLAAQLSDTPEGRQFHTSGETGNSKPLGRGRRRRMSLLEGGGGRGFILRGVHGFEGGTVTREEHEKRIKSEK